MNEQNTELKKVNDEVPTSDNISNKKMTRVLKLTNIFLIIFLVIFIGSAIYKFVFFYQQNHWQRIHKAETQQLLIKDVQTLKTENQQLFAKLEQQQLVLQEIQQNNAKIKALGQKINLLPLIETYHLTKTANLLLIADGDIKTARELLNNAIKNTEAIPSLALIKQQLISNLQSLDNSYFVNKDDLIIKIDNLIRVIETLPQFAQNTTLQQNATTEKSTQRLPENMSLWQRFANNIAKSSQNIIVIQHQNHKTPKLLNDQELSNLKQNMQFKLLNAEWAIIHNQSNLFKSSLADVKLWFNTYYSNTLPESKNISKTLDDLQKIDVSKTKFDITPTVAMINAVLMQEIHGAVQNNGVQK